MRGAAEKEIIATAFTAWRLNGGCAQLEHGRGQHGHGSSCCRSFDGRMYSCRLACASVVKELQKVVARLKIALVQDEARFTRHVFESAEAA